MTDRQNTMGVKRKNNKVGKADKIINFVRSSEKFEKLADAKLEAGDYAGALVMLQRALEIAESAENAKYNNKKDVCKDTVLFKLAEVLTDIGCFADALGFIAPLMNLGNDLNFEATRLLAFCYLGMYEYDAAEDCFYRFLNYADDENYSPEFLERIYDAADYCEQNRGEPVDDEYNETSKRPSLRDSSEIEIENILYRASKLTKEQNLDAVKLLLASALKKHPGSVSLSLMMMFTCYCGYDYKAGVAYYEKLPEKERGQLHPLCVAAALYHGAGMEAETQKCCERIMDAELELPEEYSGACSMMLEIGRCKEAMEFAQKGLDENRYSKILTHNYAKAAYELGDYELAAEQYERLAALNFNDPIAAYYKKICRRSALDGKKRVINTDYSLPSAEILKRLKRIAELINMDVEKFESVRMRWSEDDEGLTALMNWAILDKEPKFSNAFVHLIAKLGGKRAENMLRYILLDPYSDETTKQIALGQLKAMGLTGPFLVLYDGRLIEANIVIDALPKKRPPAAVIKVNDLLISRIENCTAKVKSRAKKLIYEFITDYTANGYELTDNQRNAFAVVLEYYARRGQGKDEISRDAIIEMRSITERRFINAEVRLSEVLRKAFGEENKD